MCTISSKVGRSAGTADQDRLTRVTKACGRWRPSASPFSQALTMSGRSPASTLSRMVHAWSTWCQGNLLVEGGGGREKERLMSGLARWSGRKRAYRDAIS